MRILHFSNTDTREGAQLAARRLHQGLLKAGIDSRIAVLTKTGKDALTIPVAKRDLLSRVVKQARALPIDLDFRPYSQSHVQDWEPFSDDRSPMAKECIDAVNPDDDIIVLHMVAGLVDWQSFLANIGSTHRIAIILHDMNTFTGGCHFSDNCDRFKQSCGVCPQLGSEVLHDLSHEIMKRKVQAFSNKRLNLHFIAPSQWMAEQAKCSAVLQHHPLSVVKPGVDTSAFYPQDKECVKRSFGLDSDTTVIGCMATALGNKRKGMHILMEALKRVSAPAKLAVIAIGNGELEQQPNGLRVINLGSIQTDVLMAHALNAADLFAFPSLEESAGQSALEAMACGLPLIGFNTTAVPEIVRPGITGRLIPKGDPDSLAATIDELSNAPQHRKELATNCRKIALAEYDMALHVDAHLNLYKRMMAVPVDSQPKRAQD